MSHWRSVKGRKVFAALLRIGWSIKRQGATSHKVLSRPGWTDYIYALQDNDEVGPKMLARISRSTGLQPGDL